METLQNTALCTFRDLPRHDVRHKLALELGGAGEWMGYGAIERGFGRLPLNESLRLGAKIPNSMRVL